MTVCIFSLIREGFLRSPHRAYWFISHRPAWCSCNTGDLCVGGTSFASQQGQELSYGFSWFPQSMKENAVPLPPLGNVEQSGHSTRPSNELPIRTPVFKILVKANSTLPHTEYFACCLRKFCNIL